MDDLVNELLSVQVTGSDDQLIDKQLKLISTIIGKAAPAQLTSGNALDILDPRLQTLAFALILNAYIEGYKSAGKQSSQSLPQQLLPNGTLWPHIANLLLNFDPVQIRYTGGAFQRIIETVVWGAEQTGDLIPAIQLLQHAILRLDPSSSTLTPTHYSFIRLCLHARAFSDAATILDLPIVSIPSDADKSSNSRSNKYLCSYQESSATYLTFATGLNSRWTYRSYLEYYLMGGMCYMALKQFPKALFFFEVVLTTPTVGQAISLIMAEAYKKWVLVSLLLHGKSVSMPRSVSQNTIKVIRAVAKPYDCLAQAFKTQDLGGLRAEIEAGTEIWQQDYNSGLVIEVFHAFRKFQVQKLGDTFAALPIAEVAQRTSPDPTDLDETSAYITSLLASGDLNAVLVPGSPATLRFLPTSANTKTEAEVQRTLSFQTQELRSLLRHVSNLDHRFETSKEYVEMLRKLKKIKDQEGKDGPKIANFEEIDEDMMGDGI